MFNASVRVSQPARNRYPEVGLCLSIQLSIGGLYPEGAIRMFVAVHVLGFWCPCSHPTEARAVIPDAFRAKVRMPPFANYPDTCSRLNESRTMVWLRVRAT